jgi:hypothetical protein
MHMRTSYAGEGEYTMTPAGARGTAILLCLLLACTMQAAQAAQAAGEAVPKVEVDSIRNPDMRSYRSVWAGLDAFDEHHALAPAAPLRFRILRADGTPARGADGLVLRLAGDDSSVPVTVGADGLLAIERNKAAYDADATFILNQKKGRFSAVAEIRTPGLPENVRRLGDLRLECRVMVAIARDGLNFVTRAAVNTLMLGSDWCGKKDMNLSFPVERTLDSARLSHGGRSITLDLHGKSYMAPLGNRAWPDDALIELSYAAEDPAQAQR